MQQKLWTIGVLLSLVLFCTIQDDNGNLALPGVTTVTTTPLDSAIIPSLFASPDSAYVRLGDTLGIRVRVLVDSSSDTPKPLAAIRTTAEASRGKIIIDTQTTDRDGRTRFLFTDTVAGNVEVIIWCNGVKQSLRIEVTNTPVKIQKLLQATPGASIIKADGADSTTIAVAVLNSFRNPIVGECVQFVTSSGIIVGDGATCKNSGQSATGTDGIARAKLISSNLNDTAYITTFLVSDQSLSDETEVVFQGMTINISTNQTNMKVGDTAVITARVINASEKPVAKSAIFFSLNHSNQSNLSFIAVDSLTNYEGIATARVRANSNGSDVISISAAGTKASVQVNVSTLRLKLTLDKTILQTTATDTAKLTVDFSNANGNSLSNRNVKCNRIYKTENNADTADVLSQTTNSSGRCTFNLPALLYEGTMRLNIIAFDNSEGYASADTGLQFITTRVMTIRAPQPIPADGTSKGTVSVFIKNKGGNPIVGDFITFTTNAGTITAKAQTNSDGRADVLLTSDRRNIAALITATLASDPSMKQTTTVVFKGVTLTAAANPPSISSNGTDSTQIAMSLIDAAGNPIAGERINIAKQKDATTIIRADSVTNNAGDATFKVSGKGTGQDTLSITSAGATALVVVNYSSNVLRIDTAAGQECYADSSDSTKLIVTYLKGDRSTVIPNATVEICATVGKIDTVFARTFKTDAQGKVSFYIRNPHFATTATIFALAQTSTEITTATFPLYFKANIVRYIKLAGTPEVIAINGGRAKISCIAYDSMNNRVKDARISFNIVNGPSGGEYLDPPVALTGDDGSASTYLVAGKTPSQYRQVWITAGNFASVKSDTVKFTIAGPPHYITVRTNILKGKNPNDGTFILPGAAIVTDVNGNPVPDGTDVTFSLKISGFVTHQLRATWSDYQGTTSYSCYYTVDTLTSVLPFEDFNNNYVLDPGEDRNRDGIANRGEDVNGDGKFLPGPPFLDINRDGLRQYNVNAPVETRHQCGSYTKFADLNANGYWDPIEPLLDSAYMNAYYRLQADSAMWFNTAFTHTDSIDFATLRRMDSLYTTYSGFHANFGHYDIDYDLNGIADPNTAVSITRTVKTEGGKALNEILYGQSDANRIEVMIWAESQGVVTETPEKLILPIIQDGQ